MDDILKLKIKFMDKSRLLNVCNKLNIKNIQSKKKTELRNMIYNKLNENDTMRKQVKLDNYSVASKGGAMKLSKKKNKMSVMNNKNVNMNKKQVFFPPVSKLIAIGDLHGDLVATILSLKKANVISMNVSLNEKDIKQIHWTGGKTHIVQLGDQIDRVRPSELHDDLCSPYDPELIDDEGNDLKIMCLFDFLDNEAKKVGGRCISILGNHELMNVDGDFRYVSPNEFREFGNYFNARRSLKNESFPYGFHERKNAFSPGGSMAYRMSQTRYSIVQVGSWCFVHGAIHPTIAKEYSFNDINECISKWLKGDNSKHNNRNLDILYHNEDDSMSPFWSRIYSDLDTFDSNKKTMFEETIRNINIKNKHNQIIPAKGMIMGHSPQFMYDKGINSSLNKRLWRVDVGVSKAFGKHDSDNNGKYRKIQILEIIDDGKKIEILS